MQAVITAVIRTKNSGNTLSECLAFLSNQTERVNEIIIVDSGSEDDTIEIAKTYNCHILHYPKTEKFNYSKSLNIGIESAKNPIILCLSSHVILTNREIIHKMLSLLMSNEQCAGVSVLPNHAFNDNLDFKYIKYHKGNIGTYNIFNNPYIGICNIFNNPCSMLRKKTWEKERFNEKIPFCEDQAWARYFIYNKDMFVYHIIAPTVLYKNPSWSYYRDLRYEAFIIWCIFDHLRGKKLFYALKLLAKSLFKLKLKETISNVQEVWAYFFIGFYYRLRYKKFIK